LKIPDSAVHRVNDNWQAEISEYFNDGRGIGGGALMITTMSGFYLQELGS
jgi:hypothetical protein